MSISNCRVACAGIASSSTMLWLACAAAHGMRFCFGTPPLSSVVTLQYSLPSPSKYFRPSGLSFLITIDALLWT